MAKRMPANIREYSRTKTDKIGQNWTKYRNAYNRQHYKAYTIRLSLREEADLVAFLDTIKNKKAYIKSLIESDMNNYGKGKKKEHKYKKV